jgi:hypothetical protein
MTRVPHDQLSPENAVRLKLLRSAPLNSWVALSEDESRIVATGATCAEVVERCDRAGISNPLLLKTPEQWLPLAL